MEINEMSLDEIELRIRTIDSRVARLEKVNDDWMARTGKPNDGIYKLIQKLMDDRDKLFHRKQQLI